VFFVVVLDELDLAADYAGVMLDHLYQEVLGEVVMLDHQVLGEVVMLDHLYQEVLGEVVMLDHQVLGEMLQAVVVLDEL